MENLTEETTRREPQDATPVFWQEIYWFVVLSLCGLTLAFFVLAPRLAQFRTTHDVEMGLKKTVARLDTLEKQYQSAIQAVDSDPFYREELIRSVLKVKKNDEEFLGLDPSLADR